MDGLEAALREHAPWIQTARGPEDALTGVRVWSPRVVVSDADLGARMGGARLLARVASHAPASLRILVGELPGGRDVRAVPGAVHAQVPTAHAAEETARAVASVIVAHLAATPAGPAAAAAAVAAASPPHEEIVGAPVSEARRASASLREQDVSHELGTPLTVVVTSLNLMTPRLARAAAGQHEALPSAIELHKQALEASNALVTVLTGMRGRARIREKAGLPDGISRERPLPLTMGDARFDHHWDVWRRAVDAKATMAYLAEESLDHLVELLASDAASRDPYARNVVASAVTNRLHARSASSALDAGALWAHLAETLRRIELGRSLVSASRELSMASRLMSRRDPTAKA